MELFQNADALGTRPVMGNETKEVDRNVIGEMSRLLLKKVLRW